MMMMIIIIIKMNKRVFVALRSVMGKRESGDGPSMTSASSSRRSAPAADQQVPAAAAAVLHASTSAGAAAAAVPRKTPGGRLFSLRRMIQDVRQQQRHAGAGGSSRRQHQPRGRSVDSPPVDAPPTAATPPAAAGQESAAGWYTPRATSVEVLDSAAAAESGDAAAADGSALLDCGLCALSQPRSSFARVTAACQHRACVDCLRRYLTIEIMESRVNVECPACPERLHPNDVRRLLTTAAGRHDQSPQQVRAAAELVSKYEEFALRRLLVHDPDARWCPAPDCGYVHTALPTSYVDVKKNVRIKIKNVTKIFKKTFVSKKWPSRQLGIFLSV